MSSSPQQLLELYHQLGEFLQKVSTEFQLELHGGVYLSVSNTPRRGDRKWFNFGLAEALITLKDIRDHLKQFGPAKRYEEKEWRTLGSDYFTSDSAKSLIQVQTKPVFTLLAKLIHWATGHPSDAYREGLADLSQAALDRTIALMEELVTGLSPEAVSEVPSLRRRQNRTPQTWPDGFIEMFGEALSRAGFSSS